MPRDGSLTLSEVHGPTLAIVCEECGRRGRYNVERLIAAHGDAKLTDLLTTLADCDKARSLSMYDRCNRIDDLAPERAIGLEAWRVALRVRKHMSPGHLIR